MHGFEGARADAHGSTGWVRLKLPTALGCFGSGDDSCVCVCIHQRTRLWWRAAGWWLARRPEAAAAASKAGASGPALAVLPEPTAGGARCKEEPTATTKTNHPSAIQR